MFVKNMNVLMTRNCKVLRKKVTTGTIVVLDSSGTNYNENVIQPKVDVPTNLS